MGRGISSVRSKSRVMSTRRGMKRQRSLSKLTEQIREAHGNIQCLDDDEIMSDVSEIHEECISHPEVFTKYKTAGRYVQEALTTLISMCCAGASTADICKAGDEYITAQVATVYRHTKDEKGNPVKKGLAFPTNVSVNEIVANYTGMNAPITLKDGDVVKIHLGCHIDGYPALAAHTLVVGEKMEDSTRRLLHATHMAADAVSRMLHPGESNENMTDIIQHIANTFEVQPANGVLSHRLKRFIIDGQKCVLTRRVLDEDPQIEVYSFPVKTHHVYNIDIVFTSEEPELKVSSDHTTNIYRRNEVDCPVRLKLPLQALAEIRKKHLAFPFLISSVFPESESKSKFGVKNLAKQGLLDAQPVFETRHNTTLAARFSCTAIVTEQKIDVICGNIPLPASCQCTDVECTETINAAIQRSFNHARSAIRRPTEVAETDS